MSVTLDQGQLCYRIRLIHVDGIAVFPVAIRNRRSFRVAFNVARPGTGNNQRDAAVELTDPDELARAVLEQRMSVRCQAADGSHKALYNPDGRNIVRVECVAPGAVA